MLKVTRKKLILMIKQHLIKDTLRCLTHCIMYIIIIIIIIIVVVVVVVVVVIIIIINRLIWLRFLN